MRGVGDLQAYLASLESVCSHRICVPLGMAFFLPCLLVCLLLPGVRSLPWDSISLDCVHMNCVACGFAVSISGYTY